MLYMDMHTHSMIYMHRYTHIVYQGTQRVAYEYTVCNTHAHIHSSCCTYTRSQHAIHAHIFLAACYSYTLHTHTHTHTHISWCTYTHSLHYIHCTHSTIMSKMHSMRRTYTHTHSMLYIYAITACYTCTLAACYTDTHTQVHVHMFSQHICSLTACQEDVIDTQYARHMHTSCYTCTRSQQP